MTSGIKSSIARVRGGDGRVAGAGFLVGDRLVLTCAHVVNVAVGRVAPAAERPGGELVVDFPLLQSGTGPGTGLLSASVARWVPVTGAGNGDVALLHLAGDPPGEAAPAVLVEAAEPWGHRFRVCGFPAGHDGGDWASGRLLEAQASRWLQVEDDKPTGHWVQPGYSGAPVWDEELSGIVGMAVAADRHPDAKVAYVLPTAVLLQVCPELAARSTLPCPYRGLAAFRESDAGVFFGRDAAVTRVVDAARRLQLVALVGASGSGKSSVLSAGVLPALAPQDPVVAVFRPGQDPFAALAAALLPLLDPGLSRTQRLLETPKLAEVVRQGRVDEVLAQVAAADDRPVLLLADQFEELFTLCPDAAARHGFLDGLLGGLAVPRARAATLVLALRADFYGQALAHRGLAEALQAGSVLLGPMTRDELRQAIEAPAAARGVGFEPGLVDRILADVAQRPGCLPLLEFTLTLLWDNHHARWLTHAAYDEIGGVEGALARYADQVLDALDADERDRARRVLVQLVKPGEATEDTRRLATRTELDPADWALVQRLADERLVVTDRDPTGRETAEVVHETLITAWPRLRSWMDEDREFRTWQERVRDAMEVWQRSGNDHGALLRGLPLAEAERWLNQRPRDLSPTEQEFLQASRAFKGRALRRLRALVAGLVMVLALALVAAFIAAAQTGIARREARLARSRQLAAQAVALLDRRPETALLLALEGVRTAGTTESLAALQDGLSRPYHVSTQLLGHEDAVRAVAFSRDGTTLVSGGWDRTVRLWDVRTRRALGPPLRGHEGGVWGVAFSPDGTTLASASDDHTVRLWDARSRRALGPPLRGHEGGVRGVAFSPDGTTLASASDDHTVRLWDVRSRRELGPPLRGHGGGVVGVAFSPDGATLASVGYDRTVRLWDTRSRRPLGPPLRGHELGVIGVAFSPDGTTLASASDDSTVRLWDVRTRRALGQPLRGHEGWLAGLAFSPDGRALASAGTDSTVRLWDVRTRRALGPPLRGHAGGGVFGVAFSPDGTTLASAGDDTTVRLWDVRVRKALGLPLRGHEGPVNAVAFSPDDRTLASSSDDRTVRLWNARTHRALGPPLHGHEGPVNAVAFSPDGTTLASASADRTIRLWNMRTHRPLGPPLHGHEGPVNAVAFSPDGMALASASADRTVRLWDTRTRRALGPPLRGHESEVWAVVFSPDGTTLASSSDDNTVRLWDVRTQRTLGAPLRTHSRVRGVAFSADGMTLAGGSWDRTIRLWDLRTRRTLGSPLGGHDNRVSGVAFSPDGKTLASASADRTVRLWDVRSRRAVGEPLRGHEGEVNAVAFSPDGKTLASASADRTVTLWELDLSWTSEACRLANRNLSRAEWDEFVGKKTPYVRTCPAFPSGQGAPPDAPAARIRFTSRPFARDG